MGASPGILSWGTGGSGGGGGGGISPNIVVTYNDLVSLINSNGLIPGQSYQFTMTTAHYIQFTGSLGSELVHSGTPEQLVVTAISSNELSYQASSIDYPTDVIHYKAIFTDREYDAVLGVSTGVITYREEILFGTYLTNSRDYDFRNVVFRRWESVSGSGIYDSYTNTGFSYQERYSYQIGAGLVAGVNISSPGPFSASIGFPYQLDNVVFTYGQGVISLSFLGVASTFLSGANFLQCSVMAYCSFYGRPNAVKMSVCQLVKIYDNFTFSNINEFVNCQVRIVENCSISRFSNTTALTAIYRRNNIFVCQSNTAVTVEDNNVNTLTSNLCANISSNNSYSIDSNNLLNGLAKISRNNVRYIKSNVGSTAVGINDNSGTTIVGNTINYPIYSNNVSAIENNVTAGGGIFNNTGYYIKSNSGCEISLNTIGFATNNVFTGRITGNICVLMSNNQVGLQDISNNSVVFITDNGQLGADMLIDGNVGYSIQSNIVSEITDNVVSVIKLNNIPGFISKNNGYSITSNANTGNITENIFNSIDANATGIGNIYGNTVYLITQNSSIPEAPGPHDVQWNNGQNLTSAAIGGFILNTNLLRLHSVKVTNPIQSHTFIAGIFSTIVNPTAAMSSGTPTQNVYDNATLKYVEMTITAGVITFTNIN
jgi:hypothetical protein